MTMAGAWAKKDEWVLLEVQEGKGQEEEEATPSAAAVEGGLRRHPRRSRLLRK
jgi:hypothetical protein